MRRLVSAILVNLEALRFPLIVALVGTLLVLFLLPICPVFGSFAGLSISAFIFFAKSLGLKLVPITVDLGEPVERLVSICKKPGLQGGTHSMACRGCGSSLVK